MSENQTRVTDALAQFVASSRWDDIPPEVRREGVRGLLNFVGCALGGAQDEAMDIAIKVLTPFFGPSQATVIGRSERAVHTRSTETGLPSISARYCGERSSGRHQSSGCGPPMTLGCGTTIGQSR